MCAILAALAVVSFIIFPRVQSFKYAEDQVAAANAVSDRVAKEVKAEELFDLRSRENILEAGILTEDHLSSHWGPIDWRSTTVDGDACTSRADCRAYTLEWEPESKILCAKLGAHLAPVATHVQIGAQGFAGVKGEEKQGAAAEAIRKACNAQQGALVAATFALRE